MLVIRGIAYMAEAASLRIAAFLAQKTRSQLPSALTRFYRLLHSPRIDDLQISRQILSFFAQLPCPLLPAIDWTEWH